MRCEVLKTHNVLILGWPVRPKQEWVEKYVNVTAERIYKEELSWIDKRLMNLSFHTPKYLQLTKRLSPKYWYGNWSNHVADYDTVIILDEIRGRDIFEFILENNPKCNLCVFYDSPVKRGTTYDPSNYSDMPIKFYTCDSNVSEEYGIKFMPYFYIFSPIDYKKYDVQQGVTEDKDVFFLGEEKGNRLEQLKLLRCKFDEMGVKHDLRLVRKRHGRRYTREELSQLTDYLSYSEYISSMRSSKVILELVSNGQTGITQRAYEALFYKKKLITNNEEIKRYEFYCPDNVFVIKTDDPLLWDDDELNCFIKTPTNDTYFAFKNNYTLCAWLRRFFK